MSESNSKSSFRRRRFTDDFKRSAVRLVSEEGYTLNSAAAAVGVSDRSLRAWSYAPAASTPPAVRVLQLHRNLVQLRLRYHDATSGRAR